MRDDGGLIQVNAVTLLAGLIVVMMVVLGGFTLSNPPQAVGQAAEIGRASCRERVYCEV